MENEKAENMSNTITNPHRRIVEDLKIRNKNNGKVIAGEYFGSKFTYEQTFKMFEDYKAAFLSLDKTSDVITVSSPATIASVNAFYGTIDANKIVNSVGPGFLHTFTEKYTKEIGSKTLVIFDTFIDDDLIDKLYNAGIKNVIVTTVTDYMNPLVKAAGISKGVINNTDFLDNYIKRKKHLPTGINFIRLREFAKTGAKIKENINFPYSENKIAAYFLTGATTSQIPKCVKIYADGFTKMAQIYDKTWFDFSPGERNAVFIPLFYATGAIHGVHAGLFNGLTNIYLPKYDRFAFGRDLHNAKANIALVAPSHVATLDSAGLNENELSHVKYIFIGGEAIMPAQMEKFRKMAAKYGIKYILNGYGMTETGSMSGVSKKTSIGSDVSIVPVPGVKYRIVDSRTREELPENQRGILEKYSPCMSAGYIDEEKNKDLFTSDGWIHTGDVAIKYTSGEYRVFGRESDYFINNNNKYAMFDIEEEVLKCDGVSEAEVIKFTVNGKERPAIIVVPKDDWKNNLIDILNYIENINVSGIEFLIGTRFIDKFKTNIVTSKRDYLSLPEQKTGYYRLKKGSVYENTLADKQQIIEKEISCSEIVVYTD